MANVDTSITYYRAGATQSEFKDEFVCNVTVTADVLEEPRDAVVVDASNDSTTNPLQNRSSRVEEDVHADGDSNETTTITVATTTTTKLKSTVLESNVSFLIYWVWVTLNHYTELGCSCDFHERCDAKHYDCLQVPAQLPDWAFALIV